MFKTEQENFWAGNFGDEYIERNYYEKSLIAANIALFSKIISNCNQNIESTIEFGSNIGLNLLALKTILPQLKIVDAIEINNKAVSILKETVCPTNVFNQSILDFVSKDTYDFVFIKGVLIHLCPDMLSTIYEKLYNASKKYICIVEYYNPSPVEVNYRGNQGKLFKRDFAGEMLDKFTDLKLASYGFSYHRDTKFPQDDLTWFLLEKQNDYSNL
ncbi:MAG: hypothetical protein RR998_04550 [Oscillospiraceae bacterium]